MTGVLNKAAGESMRGGVLSWPVPGIQVRRSVLLCTVSGLEGKSRLVVQRMPNMAGVLADKGVVVETVSPGISLRPGASW